MSTEKELEDLVLRERQTGRMRIDNSTLSGLICVKDRGRTLKNPGDPYHAAAAAGSGSHSSRWIGAASRSAAASRASASGRSI